MCSSDLKTYQPRLRRAELTRSLQRGVADTQTREMMTGQLDLVQKEMDRIKLRQAGLHAKRWGYGMLAALSFVAAVAPYFPEAQQN